MSKLTVVLLALVLTGCWSDKPTSNDPRIIESAEKLCADHGGVWMYGHLKYHRKVRCYDLSIYNYHTGESYE